MTTTKHRKQQDFGKIRKIHMIGIGGIGMSSIAEVLLARGFKVSGSDIKKTDITAHLETLGAIIYEGHTAEQVENVDVVVYSSAVNVKENPETVAADQLHIPLIGRAEMLGELMRMKFGIGIAGTHGKTTTTTMTGLMVAEGDFDPTVIVGGKVEIFGSNAVAGGGDIIVIEADEYDRTFLRLTPALAVITNIELEHVDIYADLDDMNAAFVQYGNSVPFYGATIVCLDDHGVQAILGQFRRRVITYGLTRQAQVRADHIQRNGLSTQFDVFNGDQLMGNITMQVPGTYNIQNALATVAVGIELEMPFASIKAGLEKFNGVLRRFQLKGEVDGITVVDDYAHHPTEVAATLGAASESWPDSRIIAVFQPHLFSRTRDFKDEFARAFFNADVLVITDIFPARETPIEGITGKVIADLADKYGHREVHYQANKKALPELLTSLTKENDVVITMGAGDIWRYGQAFLEQLENGHNE